MKKTIIIAFAAGFVLLFLLMLKNGNINNATPNTRNTSNIISSEIKGDTSESKEQVCLFCNGKGKNYCSTCRNGMVYETCSSCKGTGLRPGACYMCGGTGHVKCTLCQGTGVDPQTKGKCPTCAGKGYLGIKCTTCKGAGHLMCLFCFGDKVKSRVCFDCRGTLEILCVGCHGTGVR